MKLSYATQQLWAKKTRDSQDTTWLPLIVHMQDSAMIADLLWEEWVSDHLREKLAQSLSYETSLDIFEQDDCAKKLLKFLAAAHDIGKATPAFQLKCLIGPQTEIDHEIINKLIKADLFSTDTPRLLDSQKLPHGLASQNLLVAFGVDKSIATILGAHHGKPSSRYQLKKITEETYPNLFALKNHKGVWRGAQTELLAWALELSGFTNLHELPKPNTAAQMVFSGLLIMIDWIASNEAYFPYIDIHENYTEYLNSEVAWQRAEVAWEHFNISTPWQASPPPDNLYDIRFDMSKKGFQPNPVQEEIVDIANKIEQPGILILEAPMGLGKTEAALACAEIFAEKTGASGLYFALPTQATSDGLFPRIKDWIEHLNLDEEHTIRLAHSKAEFNDEYQSLRKNTSNNIDIYGESPLKIHAWFEGSKKSLLADFVVGTIDQVLMMALKTKHVMLRHLGLANKILIIDECHAYDAYMSQYLFMALQWLGAYEVPVIVLSATLPIATREKCVHAYLKGMGVRDNDFQVGEWQTRRDYPLITYTDSQEIQSTSAEIEEERTTVTTKFMTAEDFLERLKALSGLNGCIGIIVNTVKKAQEIFKQCQEAFGQANCTLLHSRFTSIDRAEKEHRLFEALGPSGNSNGTRPKFKIIVGTQVLEQSLNIDFDFLITEIAPMDLLLQRMGRLHRFDNTKRPKRFAKPMCWILMEEEIDRGNQFIYGEYILQKTANCLKSHGENITLPKDIPNLVQDVYDQNIEPEIVKNEETYQQLKKQHFNTLMEQERKATAFRLRSPYASKSKGILDLLDMDSKDNDHQARAQVRDSEESLEVIALFQDEQGYYIDSQPRIRLDSYSPLSDFEAKSLAKQRITLPNAVASEWNIDSIIDLLEQATTKNFAEWLDSPWLAGELILVFDTQNQAQILDYKLGYNKEIGLWYEKKEKRE